MEYRFSELNQFDVDFVSIRIY